MIESPGKTAAVTLAVAVSLTLVALPPVASMPRLMDKYNEHAQSVAQYRDKCVICHVNADGSGTLTPFGEKYERAGLAFTPGLVREFPNLFSASGDPIANAADLLASTSSPAPPAPSGASGGDPLPPARGGPWNPAKYYRAECTKCHGKYGDGDPLQAVPAFATKKWIDERSRRTDELLQILLKGKDKMVGQEGKITEEQARQLLELVRGIATKYS
jgi:mono/diheme cytochrome c family protein